LHTLIWTGLRRSEALGVKWQGVDLDAVTLRIRSVPHHLDYGRFLQSRSKTPRSRRQVALLPSSCHALKAQRDVQEGEARALVVYITQETPRVLLPRRKSDRPDSVTQAFSRIASKTGLKYR